MTSASPPRTPGPGRAPKATGSEVAMDALRAAIKDGRNLGPYPAEYLKRVRLGKPA